MSTTLGPRIVRTADRPEIRIIFERRRRTWRERIFSRNPWEAETWSGLVVQDGDELHIADGAMTYTPARHAAPVFE